MRTFFLICAAAIFCSNVLFAQVYSITPSNNITLPWTPEEEIYFEVGMKKLVSETLDWHWKIIENTFDENDTLVLCDNFNCYTVMPQEADFSPINTEITYILLQLKVHRGAAPTKSSSTIKFQIQSNSGPEVDDVVTFTLEYGASGVHSFERSENLVYPNPAENSISIHNAPNTQYSIVSAEGVVLEQGVLVSEESRVLLNNYSSGAYIVRMLKPDGKMEFATFVKR